MIHRWKSLTPPELLAAMQGYCGTWWLAGGHALDLFLGRVTRTHEDIDIVIPRNEQGLLKNFLANWQLYVADGDLTLWEDQSFLASPKNDVWVMKDRWFRFQVMLLDVADRQWVFKRDQVKLGDLSSFGTKIAGIPVIKPEIQLLYKFYLTTPREKDVLDWENTYPQLTDEAKLWLGQFLKL